MANITRNIGLSLGADLCWPLCYEQIMRRLDLKIPMGDDTIDFHVERVTIEPFDLRQSTKYDVVIDRLTHWIMTTREWIKKAIIMDDVYVFNNPWSVQSMEKHTAFCAMMHLGMPIPDTWMIPPKAYPHSPDLKQTLTSYAKLFDLGRLGPILGYPMYVKPYDGGGWRSVMKATDEITLKHAYEKSGEDVMHVQAAVENSDRFVRSIGFGPMVRHVLYDPHQPLHNRYTTETDFMSDDEAAHLRALTMTINSYFGWEFNSCESMRKDGVWHPIDFANACPDSQVTSLHYHFPWLVKAYLKWSLFCAATKRPMRRTLDWDPYYAVAAGEGTFEEMLKKYEAIADERFETEKFNDFCDKHLRHLDEVAWEYFGSDEAKAAIQQKVFALYPEHEVDAFTNLFWGRIQKWRDENAQKED